MHFILPFQGLLRAHTNTKDLKFNQNKPKYVPDTLVITLEWNF